MIDQISDNLPNRWPFKVDEMGITPREQASESGTIALFVPSLGGGGAERVMLTLAEGLSERGHAVDLVVTGARGALVSDVPSRVRLVDLGAPRVIASLPALVRYFRKVQPVAMLSAMAGTNCVAVWARQLSGVRTRLILSEHNHLSLAASNAPTRRGRFLPVLMRRAYPKADGIVAVSGGVADDLAATLDLPRERIHVIYNPVVTPRMLSLSLEPPSHKWLGGHEPPVILSVGRLTAQKDYATLLRAFATVRKNRPARLMILGEGEERPALEQLAQKLGIADDVALPGFVSNPFSYMRAAAVFVLSSRWEGFGNVLAEAMACGTPVMSTDCPSGPAEILDGGTHGFLTAIGDSDSLANAMCETIDMNTQTSREQRTARSHAFSVDIAAEAYLGALGVGPHG